MCLYIRDVYLKHLKRSISVKCGKCPACLQEKANKRALRICANIDDENKLFDRLFLSLNYKPEFVPYIKENELISFLDYSSSTLPIYRDFDYFHYYNRHEKKYYDTLQERAQPLKVLNDEDFKTSKLDRNRDIDTIYKYLRKKGDRFRSVDYGKIGVCYFKDIQDFIKRVRNWLNYRGYDFKISFYACTEYGETTARPHVHILLQVPTGYYALVKRAVVACWRFGDCDTNDKAVQLALKPAAYIASYVNCSGIVSGFLAEAKPVAVKHSYSQSFGVAKGDFTFSEVLQSYERRSLKYLAEYSEDGVRSSAFVLLPKYVINRYFPRFKGYRKLSIDEVRFIVSNPSAIYAFAERLELTLDDCHKIQVMLHNKLVRYCPFEEIKQRYVDAYANVWNVYYSQQLKMLHDSKIPELERYDNILSFVSGEIESGFISFSQVHGFLEVDPNRFLHNVVQDAKLRDKYYRNNKSRKVNSLLYE